MRRTFFENVYCIYNILFHKCIYVYIIWGKSAVHFGSVTLNHSCKENFLDNCPQTYSDRTQIGEQYLHWFLVEALGTSKTDAKGWLTKSVSHPPSRPSSIFFFCLFFSNARKKPRSVGCYYSIFQTNISPLVCHKDVSNSWRPRLPWNLALISREAICILN